MADTSTPASPSPSASETETETERNGLVVQGTSANSCKLGTLRNTPILVHWLIIFLLGFNCLLSMIYTHALEVLLFHFLLYGPAIIVSLLVHELGHYIAAKKLGAEVDQIIIWPLGGLTIYGPTDRGVKGDLIVAIAGPLMQIPIMIVLTIIYLSLMTPVMPPFQSFYINQMDVDSGIGPLLLGVCRVSFWYNLFIFVINLVVPIYPMDGLRIWAACLRSTGMGVTKTAKVVAYLGMLGSFALFLYGAFILFDERRYGGITEMFLGAFGFVSSSHLRRLVVTDRLRLDPVFGRTWYLSEDSRGVEMSGASSNNYGNRPSQPVPVEVAESAEIL